MTSPAGRARVSARAALAALLLLACSAPDGGEDAGSRPETAPRTGEARPAPAAPGETMPEAAVRAAMQGSAADLVALLLVWDTADLRFAAGYEEALQAAWCLEAAGACGGDEADGDELLVVDGYQVEPVFGSADSAQLMVTHDVVGTVWQGGMGDAEGAPPVTLTLRRLERGWRIVAAQPPLARHLSRSALLRRFAGVAPDSLMLARWLRER